MINIGKNYKMEILVDFDGTCVAHDYPRIGKDIGAVPVLRELIDNGHRLILFTMRSDLSEESVIENVKGIKDGLTQAVRWFEENDIPLYGIQTNPTQSNWTQSPKPYGQLIIDDIGLGIPLTLDLSISPRPFVDWSMVREMLKYRRAI